MNLTSKFNKICSVISIAVALFVTMPSISFAQTASQWDLLNLFEHEKLVRPDIIKPYQIVGVQQAWQKIKDANPSLNNVTIGIIDTGVDSGHQEFTNPNVRFGNTPPDALVDTPVTGDLAGHGTHVVGVVGANNISAISGYVFPQMNGILSGVLSPNLYSLEVRRYQSFIKAERIPIVLGLEFKNVTTIGKLSAVLEGMNTGVTNLSIGLLKCSTFLGLDLPSVFGCVKDKYFPDVTNFFKEGFESQLNTLFVISAGNENTDSINSTPANVKLNNILIVGATGLNDERADFPFPKIGKSNFGSGVDISAPGIGLYAPAMRGKGNFPQANGDYVSDFSGTSASAPMVTGVAGLLKAIKPELTPAEIKDILVRNADPIQTDKPIGGRLNALKAVCDPLVLNCAPTPPPQPSNTWQPVNPMTTERAEHTSTLLNDGRVLITGSFKGNGQTFIVLNSAEIFNPATGNFTSIGNMTTPRTFHTATLLQNGKVLIIGGVGADGSTALKTAEIFDPNTNTFNPAGSLNTKRFFHTADILPDGKVLIAGGHTGGTSLKSTEIFDVSTNAFSLGSDMNIERWHHASAELNDGRIALINGLTTAAVGSLEIFDPIANNFTLITSSLPQLGLGAVTLLNGKIFISGSTQPNQTSGISAEIFDSSDSTFTEVGPMLFPLVNSGARQAAVLLSDERVLMVGNNLKAQVFDPQTSLFKFTGNLVLPRSTRHRLTILPDGRVLLTGGQTSLFQTTTTNKAEIFNP